MQYRVGIYKDKRETLLIIPKVYDENKILRDLNKPVFLNVPYDFNMIGRTIRKCFEVCAKELFQHSKDAVKVYEIATGVRSFAKFTKERDYVTCLMDAENGYKFSPWQRYPDGSYRPIDNSVVNFEVGLEAEDEKIGEIIMNAFALLNISKTV